MYIRYLLFRINYFDDIDKDSDAPCTDVDPIYYWETTYSAVVLIYNGLYIVIEDRPLGRMIFEIYIHRFDISLHYMKQYTTRDGYITELNLTYIYPRSPLNVVKLKLN